MREEPLSRPEKIRQLWVDLALYHSNNDFLACRTRGQIVTTNIRQALSYYAIV